GTRWLWGCREALLMIDAVSGKLLTIYPYANAWALCKVSDSTYLCGSFSRDEVGVLNTHTGRVEVINSWKTDDGSAIGGYAGTIRKVDEDRYAMASRYFGVYIIDVRQKTAVHLTSNPDDAATIRSNYCRSLYITRNGTLLVHSKGLSFASLQPVAFRFVTSLSDGTQKYRDVINCFLETSPGKLWIGTNIGLALKDSRTGLTKFYAFYDSSASLQKLRTVRALAKDADNRVWAGTFGGGIGLLKKDGSFEQIRAPDKDPAHAKTIIDIWSMVNLPGNKLLLCANGGFSLFDPARRSFRLFDTHPVLKDIATNTTYHALAEGQNWWLAQAGGLYCYNTQAQSLRRISIPAEVSGTVQCLARDANGNIYAGGLNGVHLISKSSHKVIKTISKAEGLASGNIVGLLADDRGIWIIGNRGLSRYLPGEDRIEGFDAREGVLQGNHKTSSYYRAADGTIYIGSENGYNYFNPDDIRKQEYPLPVYITGLQVKGATAGPFAGDLRLAHDENNLSFSYLAVDYKTGPYLQYRYRLEGFDTNYVYAGKQRVARYTNLPAGKYHFSVEASTNGKDWSAAAKAGSFIITKAYWQKLWFQALVLLALACAGYAAYRYRVRRIRQAARYRSDYEIKLNELENSALRTQMNPHFIFNSLNTINSFISRNETVQANQYISKFSRLIRFILDHSRQRRILLSDELEVLDLYIQIEQIRFAGKFSYELRISEEIDTSIMELPPLIIQPFVENAILHGLLPLQSGGKLRIGIDRREHWLWCIVEDNGIGRAKAKDMSKDLIYKRKSHGIDITLKRIELFNRESGFNASVVITDLYDADGNPSGTRVEIPIAWQESF
ncbi:MAG TPA: histidine kinase, partial [Flavisolibacter sp.]|nr:histidine kinase [Flavisolibacter sp.]